MRLVLWIVRGFLPRLSCGFTASSALLIWPLVPAQFLNLFHLRQITVHSMSLLMYLSLENVMFIMRTA